MMMRRCSYGTYPTLKIEEATACTTPVLSLTATALNARFSPSFSISPPPAEPLPHLDRPVSCAALIDNDQNHFKINGESVQTSDEDTKKSFDLTGELKLNESDASD